MEFLVEFHTKVPDGTEQSEVVERERAGAAAAAGLEGRLVRVWKRPLPTGGTTVLGLYRADSETELEGVAQPATALRVDDCQGQPARASPQRSRGGRGNAVSCHASRYRAGSAEVLARLGRGEDVKASE
jgi:muconolactone delta-isomerase